MSYTCWRPENKKVHITNKCDDVVCSIIKSIETIGVNGLIYLGIGQSAIFEPLVEETNKQVNTNHYKKLWDLCD